MPDRAGPAAQDWGFPWCGRSQTSTAAWFGLRKARRQAPPLPWSCPYSKQQSHNLPFYPFFHCSDWLAVVFLTTANGAFAPTQISEKTSKKPKRAIRLSLKSDRSLLVHEELLLPNYSHSMVPGGLEVISYTIRLMLRTSLTMRTEVLSKIS